MGQQQLLLIVVGIMIVGVSVAAGVSGSTDAHQKFSTDEINLEARKIAVAILEWKMKPSEFGGGSSSPRLKGLTFDELGMQSSDASGENSNNAFYWRNIRDLVSPRPFIQIIPKNNPKLRIQLFMYGPSVDCFKVRVGQKLGDQWINDTVPVGKNNPPDACKVWR